MKIISETPKSIPLSEMEDGQIAIITEFIGYEGCIVQRYGIALIALGKPSGQGWSNIFTASETSLNSVRVRILEVGTKIEV